MQSFACSSASLAAVLSPEALITSLSFSAEQFTGYSAQDLVGRPISWILADSSAFQLPRILEAAKEWGYWDGQIVHKARDGNFLKAHCMLSLLAANGNNTAGYLLVSNVSTSPVLNECERSAVTEVATSLRAFAHDLNNPLAVLTGYAQLLGSNKNCGFDIREDIERFESELRRAIQIVGKLHEYALSLYEKPKPDQASDTPARSIPAEPSRALSD